MINEKMYGLGDEPSAIRELFAYGMARKAEIGAENVFDFSIGNPSVPAPDLVRETMLELLDMDPVTLHAYSPAAGLPEVKEAIAAYLSARYGMTATPGHLYLTAGAAAALASSIAAVTQPGDEVVVVSPYFPEYRTWIEAAGCAIVEVPAAVPTANVRKIWSRNFRSFLKTECLTEKRRALRFLRTKTFSTDTTPRYSRT